MANKDKTRSSSKTDEHDSETQEATDALFQLPLADFTAARNALASRLRKEGRASEAARVKALAKPAISAWVVNQLYWTDHAAFGRLLEAGARVRGANLADLRAPLDVRREAIRKLLRAAETLLRDAGHNPTSEIMRRVESTLEAVSADPGATQPGRLTADLTPPGFDLLASMFPNEIQEKLSSQPAGKSEPPSNRPQDSRQAAEEALRSTRERCRSAETALKEAEMNVRLAETLESEAKERFEKAAAAADESRHRARKAANEVAAAAEAVKVAERALED